MHYWPKNIHRAFSAYSKNYLLEPNTNSSHIFTIWIGENSTTAKIKLTATRTYDIVVSGQDFIFMRTNLLLQNQ